MFVFVCTIVGAIIVGILFYKDGDEDSVLGVMLGALSGTASGLVLTLIISIILCFAVSPTITENTYKLERHIDTSSYTYYVDVDNFKYALSYFDENTIIREEGISNASFTFEEKSGEVKITKKRYGGVLDFFFFNFYLPQYDITIPSKEYIRYE